MNNFKELIVWQKAMDMAVEIYKLTNLFPEQERFGLVSQMRRSVISIPSNIAEGAGRASKKEFARFLSIALGSSFELETQVSLAERLEYKLNENILDRINHIQNMIFNLRQSVLN